MTDALFRRASEPIPQDDPTPVWANTPLEVLREVPLPILKEFLRGSPCLACGRPPRSDVAHVRSRGAGGTDDAYNQIPLCRRHHMEQHQFGWLRFVSGYRRVKVRLEGLGWEFRANGKLWHPEMVEVDL